MASPRPAWTTVRQAHHRVRGGWDTLRQERSSKWPADTKEFRHGGVAGLWPRLDNGVRDGGDKGLPEDRSLLVTPRVGVGVRAGS